MTTRRITIIEVRRGNSPDINIELQWLGNSLGLFNLRDKNSSCFRVFITLIRKAKRNEPITSDDISEKLNLSRGTVVHHLTKLMESGIVVREKEGYLLRENSLQQVIKDLKKDMDSVFSNLSEVAEEVDERMG